MGAPISAVCIETEEETSEAAVSGFSIQISVHCWTEYGIPSEFTGCILQLQLRSVRSRTIKC